MLQSSRQSSNYSLISVSSCRWPRQYKLVVDTSLDLLGHSSNPLPSPPPHWIFSLSSHVFGSKMRTAKRLRKPLHHYGRTPVPKLRPKHHFRKSGGLQIFRVLESVQKTIPVITLFFALQVNCWSSEDGNFNNGGDTETRPRAFGGGGQLRASAGYDPLWNYKRLSVDSGRKTPSDWLAERAIDEQRSASIHSRWESGSSARLPVGRVLSQSLRSADTAVERTRAEAKRMAFYLPRSSWTGSTIREFGG